MSSLRERNLLYARLEEVLGPEHAVTLMNQFPTDSDLATKVDVTELGTRFDGLEKRFDHLEVRFEALEGRFGGQLDGRLDRIEGYMVRFDDKLDGFHQALRDQSRTYMLTMTGVMASFAAVVVAAGILN